MVCGRGVPWVGLARVRAREGLASRAWAWFSGYLCAEMGRDGDARVARDDLGVRVLRGEAGGGACGARGAAMVRARGDGDTWEGGWSEGG